MKPSGGNSATLDSIRSRRVKNIASIPKGSVKIEVGDIVHKEFWNPPNAAPIAMSGAIKFN
jgi:hypothetical protein